MTNTAIHAAADAAACAAVNATKATAAKLDADAFSELFQDFVT